MEFSIHIENKTQLRSWGNEMSRNDRTEPNKKTHIRTTDTIFKWFSAQTISEYPISYMVSSLAFGNS